MRKLFVILTILAGILTNFNAIGTAAPDTDEHKDITAMAQANNAFACEVYNKISKDKDNIFFSPLSIYTSLAMTYAGARGETAAEMENALLFPLKNEEFNSSFAAFMRHLNSQENDVQMYIANSLWPKTGADLLENYLEIITKDYKASAQELDFEHQEDVARKTINQWIEEKTNNKITNLLNNPLPDDTKLLLVNTIYFKGSWLNKFKAAQTMDGDFFTNSGAIKVPFMHQSDLFRYGEDKGNMLQILEMPYAGNKFSMLIFLPQGKSNDALKNLEKRLNPKNINAWRATLNEQMQIRVELPKFKTTWGTFDFTPTLKSLGLKAPFSAEADFSGISTNEKLNINQILHKAFINIDEEGTEAAAATAVDVVAAFAAPPAQFVFRAERPFIFLIQDTETGAILFMGRMADPSKEQ